MAQGTHISDLNKEVLYRSQEIVSLNQKLVVKSDKIADLNRELMGSVIGGDSFCYLLPVSSSGKISGFILKSKGKYPLYDLSFRIIDLDKSDALLKEGLSLDNFLNDTIYQKNVGVLKSHSAKYYSEKMLVEAKDLVRLKIFFDARNGGFDQLLRMHKVDNEWQFIFKVVKFKGNKETVLMENIPDGYPRNAKGQVQW